MAVYENLQVLLAARPAGLPKTSDWNVVRSPARPPETGEVLVAVEYISMEPAMRVWMNEAKTYTDSVQLGSVMRAGGIGKVVVSNAEALPPGNYVTGNFGSQSHSTVPAKLCRKIDPDQAPLPVQLNILGITGMTAYFGLLEVGQVKAGDTVVVSGAAGAVGAVAGQIARIKGCRVVGIAGGPEKCKFLTDELGFDAAIDYKAGDLDSVLRQHCPNGIDVYFDNVGGEILNACLGQIALHARVVLCGAISQYNATTPPKGPGNYLSLLFNAARMQGVVVFEYASRYKQASADLAGWMQAGQLQSKEHIVEGLETFPTTLLKLFSGQNFGKLILKV